MIVFMARPKDSPIVLSFHILDCIETMRVIHSNTSTDARWKSHRGSLLRSVFTVGVMCKYFNMESVPIKEGAVSPQ